MKQSPLLNITQLSLRFGGLRVLEDVDMEVGGAELVALIGPNGAGKTSLLNCVSGFYRPEGGSIWFDGHEITVLPPHQLPSLGIARTFQLPQLIPDATVLENILAGRHVQTRSSLLAAFVFWGAAHREQQSHMAVAEEIIEFLELEQYRHRRAGDLPQGLQRRVELARALAMQPRLLLLDEPSSGLSREEREDFARFLLRLRYERPMAILWVEHDTQLVQDLADRIVVLHYGRKIADGVPVEVLRLAQVLEAYLGTFSSAGS